MGDAGNENGMNALTTELDYKKKRVMVIGTSSTYRATLLRQHFGDVFQDFILFPPNIEEKAYRDSDPFRLTELIARAKMQAVLEKLKQTHSTLGRNVVVITFDQVAVKDGQVREKPVSVEENKEFLSSYSNSSVRTVGAYALYSRETEKIVVAHDESETFFSSFGDDVIERIIGRGVSMNAAGGFVVEDEELSRYVVRVVGTLEGVRGMDPTTVARLLRQVA